jgi:hypothetical protein
MFELVRAVPDESETAILSPRIYLYELPVFEDDGPIEDETPAASYAFSLPGLPDSLNT